MTTPVPPAARPDWPLALVCATAAGSAALLLAAPAHAPQGGLHPGSRSLLDVTDGYLPALADTDRAAVFSNIPLKFLAQWTYLQRYGRARPLETDIHGFDPQAQDNAAAQNWLAATDCDTVIYVDIPPGAAFYAPVPGGEGSAQYGELMERQTRFPLAQRLTFPASGCRVTVWRRRR